MPGYPARLKQLLLRGVSRLTGRHAVLLPLEAADEGTLLNLSAPYRVAGDRLVIDLHEPAAGTLEISVMGYQGHFPSRLLWQSSDQRCAGPTALTLAVGSGEVHLGGERIGTVKLEGRRFAFKLRMHTADGRTLSRTTGHYLVIRRDAVDENYFQGDTYVDHAAEAAGEWSTIRELLGPSKTRPVLEIGCATGGVLAALGSEGYTAVGVDISAWAVEQAAARLGPGRAFVMDLERDPFPEEITRLAPYGTVIMWAVMEHFARPFEMLDKLAALTAPGTTVLINTTNAGSLCSRIFGDQWEGHFDWTHAGVDQITVATMRDELPRRGWRIERLDTHLAWDTSADPTHATVREWYSSDARFRQLLRERDLGDFLTCIAVRV